MPRKVLLLGNPVLQSLSPAMQNAAFSALQFDYRYLPREITAAQLASTIAELRASDDILGANVTIPFKEVIIPFLDELDEISTRTGAVNTISKNGIRLRGFNTDVVGFRRALDDCGYLVKGQPVAVIGAGGAARAVVQAVHDLAAHVWVIARQPGQAQRLISDLRIGGAHAVPIDRMAATIGQATVVVNATPADLPPIGLLRADQQFFDVRSRRSAEGRAMLLHQGAASFQIWTGRSAPIDVMRAALAQASEVVRA